MVRVVAVGPKHARNLDRRERGVNGGALNPSTLVNNFTSSRDGSRAHIHSTGRDLQMRFFGFTAVAAGALMLGACGGGNKNADTTAVAATTTTSAESAATAPAGSTAAAAATPAAGTATAAPVTGTVREIKMVGDEKGYRFDPASITIKAGDGLKFVNVSGGPHNIAFDPSQIPTDVQPQLSANMPNTTSPLTGPLLTQPNEAYTVSFANVKPGTYEGHCVPHLALGMKIAITVQ